MYGNLQVVEVESWNSWYTEGYVNIADLPNNLKFQENQGVVLKAVGVKEHGIVKGDKIIKLKYPMAYGIKPRNTEQFVAMNMLLDDKIKLKVITGREGCGKTILTAACILELLLEQTKYKKLVLTRTTDEVGKSLGLLPGTVDEKFANHNASFKYAFKALMGKQDDYLDVLMHKKVIEYIPIQFMRGISFPEKTIIWADEIAGLSAFELRMLCTRLGENCILVLTGSFEQIDRKLKKEETGLYKLVSSDKIGNSTLCSHIELIKNERSELSKLISDVL